MESKDSLIGSRERRELPFCFWNLFFFPQQIIGFQFGERILISLSNYEVQSEI